MEIKQRERVKSGILGLDDMCSGGIPKGNNVLVSGPCGSGKSTMAMQYVYNGAKKYNEPGVYFTLEETVERIYRDSMNFGWDLKSLKNIEVTGGPFIKLSSYVDERKAKVDDILSEIKDIIEEKKAERVAIDSLNLFTMLFEEQLQQRKALIKLCNKLTDLGCTSLLTCEAREGRTYVSELSLNGIEEYVADGVIVLYYVNNGYYFIQGATIRKMRGSAHDKVIRPFSIEKGKGIVIRADEEITSLGKEP